jgi:hypothetical protein
MKGQGGGSSFLLQQYIIGNAWMREGKEEFVLHEIKCQPVSSLLPKLIYDPNF